MATATGMRIGNTLQNIANLGVGIVLSLYYGWAIALLIIGFVPFLILSGIVQTQLIGGFAAKDKESMEKVCSVKCSLIFIYRNYISSNQYRQEKSPMNQSVILGQ